MKFYTKGQIERINEIAELKAMLQEKDDTIKAIRAEALRDAADRADIYFAEWTAYPCHAKRLRAAIYAGEVNDE